MTEALRPFDHRPEEPTPPRYSLAYDQIGSQDTTVRHPNGTPVRIVSYEKPTNEQAAVRESLLEKGLILGRIRSEIDDQEQQFVVPSSARPIGYDARVVTTGAFSYSDEHLFFDLGSLLGELFMAGGKQYVLDGNLGRSIALVEFTRPNERQLFFVPGIERITTSLEPEVSPVGYYADKLMEAFGHRFDDDAISFRMGFAEATHSEV